MMQLSPLSQWPYASSTLTISGFSGSVLDSEHVGRCTLLYSDIDPHVYRSVGYPHPDPLLHLLDVSSHLDQLGLLLDGFAAPLFLQETKPDRISGRGRIVALQQFLDAKAQPITDSAGPVRVVGPHLDGAMAQFVHPVLELIKRPRTVIRPIGL